MNNVRSSNDDRHGIGMAFSLMNRAHEGQDSERDKTVPTTM